MLTFGVPVLKLTTGVILNLVHASPKTDCNALTIATLIGGLFGGMLVLCVFKVAATSPLPPTLPKLRLHRLTWRDNGAAKPAKGWRIEQGSLTLATDTDDACPRACDTSCAFYSSRS